MKERANVWSAQAGPAEVDELLGGAWSYDRISQSEHSVSGVPIPTDAIFSLEQVNLDDVIDQGFSEADAMAGEDWDTGPDDRYARLEQQLRADPSQVPPVVLVADEHGDLMLEDGRRRVTIARHAGLTTMAAYVYRPSAAGDPGSVTQWR